MAVIIRKCDWHTRGYGVEPRPSAFLRLATWSGHVMLICCHSKSVYAVAQFNDRWRATGSLRTPSYT
jgi:hypothetical protein